MAYTKTNWVNEGPPAIDADNLNHIEQGIYDNSLEITALKQDYIIAEGTSGDWYYRKWKSGHLEAWCNTSLSFAVSIQSGSFYIGNSSVSIPSVIGVSSIKYVDVVYTGNEGDWTKVNTLSTTSVGFALISGVSRAATSRTFMVYLQGTYSS